MIRHALRLQEETFTGRSHHQRKFSNVAREHHFCACSGMTCSVTASQPTDVNVGQPLLKIAAHWGAPLIDAQNPFRMPTL
jgi:hypothetical protein